MIRLVRLILVVLALTLAMPCAAGVQDTAHNLSAGGPGNVKSPVETRICIYCHISHSANEGAPLWSRRKPAVNYIPYSSSTIIANPGQPTGTSILCLSCHDGTIAIGEIMSGGRNKMLAGNPGRMPPGRGLQGTDLSDDHPISFEYSADLAARKEELAMPETLASQLRLDMNGELQCTTCHDAHDSPYEKLLVLPNIGSQLCVECHKETGWEQSSHSQSAATWNGRPPNPWRGNDYANVMDNGCENCHAPHDADSRARLLKYVAEEDNCADCHNGNVASKDVMAAFELLSTHRLGDTTQIHDPVEPAVIQDRHVECADCHDPHATQSSGVSGDVPANVRGVNLGGAEVSQATRTYEICLRCHGDSPDQIPSATPRQHDQQNMRLKIQPDNPSFHPIAEPGGSDDVPSLIFPLTEQTVIGCGDCHNSSAAAGGGAEGPHGSMFEPLLVRNYSRLDNIPESAAAYSLCYGCHSRDSILNDESFAEHDLHVRGENTPCNACHDPHGISSTQGNATNNSHLINFDTSIVFPNSSSLLQFVDNGDRAGSCDLMCHGEEHNNFDYQP